MAPIAFIDLDSDDEAPTSPSPQNATTNLPRTTREDPIDLTFEDSESERLPSNGPLRIPTTVNSPPRTPAGVANSTQGRAAPQLRSSPPEPVENWDEDDSDEDFLNRLKQTHKQQAKRVKRSLNGPDAQIAIPTSPSPPRRRAARVSKNHGSLEAPEEDEDTTSVKIPAHVRRLSKTMNNPEAKGNTTKKSSLRVPPLTSASKKKDSKAKDPVNHTRRIQNVLKRIKNAPTEALIPPVPNASRATTSITGEEPTTTRTQREKQPQKNRTPRSQSPSGKEDTESSEAGDPLLPNFSTDVSHFFSPSTELGDAEAEQTESMDYELDQTVGPYDPSAASRGAGSSRDTAKYEIYDIPQSGWRSQAAPSAPSASSNPINQGSTTGSDHASHPTTTNSSSEKDLDKSTLQLNPAALNDPTPPAAAAVDAPKRPDNRKRKRKAGADTDDEDVYLPRSAGKKARAQRERDTSQDETELFAFLDGIQATLAPKSKQIESSEGSTVDKVGDEITTSAQFAEQHISSPSESGNADEGVADEIIQDHEALVDNNEVNNDADIEMTPADEDIAIPPAHNHTDSEIDELEDDDLDDIQLDTELILGSENENLGITPQRPGFLDLIRASQPSPAKGTGPGYLYTPSIVSTPISLPIEPTPQENTSPQAALNPLYSDGIAEVEDILVNQLSPKLPTRSPEDIVEDSLMEGMEEVQGDSPKNGHDGSDEGDQTILAINADYITHHDGLPVVEQVATTVVEPVLSSPNPKTSTLVNSLDTMNLSNPSNLTFPVANNVEPREMGRQKLLADNMAILSRVPRFQGGYQRPSLTPLDAPWEILRTYFKRRIELEGENLATSSSAQRQESSVEL